MPQYQTLEDYVVQADGDGAPAVEAYPELPQRRYVSAVMSVRLHRVMVLCRKVPQ